MRGYCDWKRVGELSQRLILSYSKAWNLCGERLNSIGVNTKTPIPGKSLTPSEHLKAISDTASFARRGRRTKHRRRRSGKIIGGDLCRGYKDTRTVKNAILVFFCAKKVIHHFYCVILIIGLIDGRRRGKGEKD